MLDYGDKLGSEGNIGGKKAPEISHDEHGNKELLKTNAVIEDVHNKGYTIPRMISQSQANIDEKSN